MKRSFLIDLPLLSLLFKKKKHQMRSEWYTEQHLSRHNEVFYAVGNVFLKAVSTLVCSYKETK